MIPPTARRFDDALDPADELDFYIQLTRGEDGKTLLHDDEKVIDFALILPPEAVVAGLQIATSGRYALRLSDDDIVAFGLSFAEDVQILPAFNAPGIEVPLELTVWTDQERKRQKTVVVRAVNQ